ncbi:MAG: peptidylprolyl isomerase [Verrucomicrobia bacterium]|nr:peptidylprolyl isomerase [Cytophagales bacterium]
MMYSQSLFSFSKKNTGIVCFLMFLLTSCQQAKQEIAIPPDQVTAVLTQFGKENPENQVVIHVKNVGDIYLKLYEEMPLHRANFVRLIKLGHFKSGNFYRIVSDFMIQGGNQTVAEQKFTIPAEFNEKFIFKKGVLAMARRDENNPDKRSSPTEFFIISGRSYQNEASLKDAIGDAARTFESYTSEQIKTYLQVGGDARMDFRYTVFGEVTQGLALVEQLAQEPVYEGEKPMSKLSFTVELTKTP